MRLNSWRILTLCSVVYLLRESWLHPIVPPSSITIWTTYNGRKLFGAKNSFIKQPTADFRCDSSAPRARWCCAGLFTFLTSSIQIHKRHLYCIVCNIQMHSHIMNSTRRFHSLNATAMKYICRLFFWCTRRRQTKAQLGWVVTMLTTKVEENSPNLFHILCSLSKAQSELLFTWHCCTCTLHILESC